jgi:hypothetical protein
MGMRASAPTREWNDEVSPPYPPPFSATALSYPKHAHPIYSPLNLSSPNPSFSPLKQLQRLWLPLTCRSLPPLRKLCEDLATSTYRQSQDLMSAAIFYLAAGKRSVLRQLAKTSRDDRRALDKLMMQVQTRMMT